MLDSLKIAIVADWLTVFAGAERVVYELHKLFPKAPIYTSLYDKDKCSVFSKAGIIESNLKYLPFARKFHRLFFPFMPMAFEKMDFSNFDIVISSSHSASKGIITKPETLHISYCHSPMRYVWDQSHSYQKNYRAFLAFRIFYKPLLHKMRIWDRIASARVDKYIANSSYVSDRIKKYYKRESTLIYPPVDLSFFRTHDKKSDYYLAVGRLISYKKFDLIIKTFNELMLPLKVVGDGPELKALKKMAKKNIEFLHNVSDEELRKIYQNAKALIYPQVEDFGITPLEAMASGTPVIAFAKGGSLETVKENVSGTFFNEQTEEALVKAVKKFNKKDWNSKNISQSVERFSTVRFKMEMLHFLEKAWKEHKEMLG